MNCISLDSMMLDDVVVLDHKNGLFVGVYLGVGQRGGFNFTTTYFDIIPQRLRGLWGLIPERLHPIYGENINEKNLKNKSVLKIINLNNVNYDWKKGVPDKTNLIISRDQPGMHCVGFAYPNDGMSMDLNMFPHEGNLLQSFEGVSINNYSNKKYVKLASLKEIKEIM